MNTPPKLPDLKPKTSEPSGDSDGKRAINRSMSALVDEADRIRTE